MNRVVLLMAGMMLMLAFAVPAHLTAQDAPPVPTLVPPTPLPSTDAGVNDALPAESALAQIQAAGKVRVGILFNAPPFGELNIRGEVVGFDAALMRSMAEAWGVEAEFVQVTRQTAFDALLAGEVDLLAAALVHHRDLDGLFEFSQTYYRGGQTVMVRLDDAAQSVSDMNGRRIGVVMGTAAEGAVAYWQTRTGVNISLQSYLTLDQAIVALANNEVDGVVDKRYVLRERVLPDVLRVLDDDVQPEPYAIAMRRQDVATRNLVNRTLQYLAQSGRLADIHAEYFPGRPFPPDTVPQWDNIGEEAPTPGQFNAENTYPTQYRLPLVRNERVLRVAGIPQNTDGLPEGDQRLARANTALAQAIAARMDANVAIVPNTEGDPIGAVERGDADIALGVRPDWNQINRVDFAGTYLLRGKRLLVEERDDYDSLGDLRGKWVGVFASEPGTDQLVRELGESVNASLNIFTITRDEDAVYEMLVENNIDVVFGDSIRLLPHLEANPELKLSDRCPNCDPWYTREYLGVAVPRNDPDFRLLIEYSLQEIWQDGTLNSVLSPVTVPGESLPIEIWPGDSEFMGFQLGA